MSPACAAPVTDELLLDLWTGELPEDETRAIEEHLLACASCAARARELQAVAASTSTLVRNGQLAVVMLPAVVERLRSEGRAIREYRAQTGGTVLCTVSPDDDVVLARLAADFHGVERVDVVARLETGPENRLLDVPFDPASTELILTPGMDALHAFAAEVMRFRLLAVEPEGERLLGEYTFKHRPWPGW